MESNTLTIFSYGSLMNDVSLRQTLPDAMIKGVGFLPEYRREFNFKSPDRINPETSVHSSVLNLAPDKDHDVVGIVFEIPESLSKPLFEREKGYTLTEVELRGGDRVQTFIATGNGSYEYIFDDPTQEEYLQICAVAARSLGRDVYDNFLCGTFIRANQSVWDYLHD